MPLGLLAHYTPRRFYPYRRLELYSGTQLAQVVSTLFNLPVLCNSVICLTVESGTNTDQS